MKPPRALLSLLLSALLALAAVGQPASPPSAFPIPPTDAGLPGAGPIRRAPWFQKIWTERHTAWASRGDHDHDALLFLGDSITDNWGDTLGGSFPGVKVANRAIGGDTTRGVLIRLQDDVLALHPNGVVLLIGTNDLADGAEIPVIVGNLQLILAALEQSNPRLPIVLCEVFPSSPTKDRPAERIRALNAAYLAAVRGDPRITVLDTWSLYADAQGDAPVALFPDLLHPNQAGYAKWAAALRPILATLGYLENEPEAFTPEPGFSSLFNGHDLTGWEYPVTSDADRVAAGRWAASNPSPGAWPVVTAPVRFDGLTATPDGRYVAHAGRLIVTTPPEGRKIQRLATTRQFSRDFVLRLEFRATPNADSGVFVRAPQLQCRDYLLAGPYKDLKQYRPQDWNSMEIVVTGGTARCTCNGELLEAALAVPTTGPIALEGDRGQMEYRHIRIKEQP